MGNKIKVVDGVKGEWRSVTKAEEVKVGQRIRYAGDKVGFEGKKRFVESIALDGKVSTWDGKNTKNGAYNILNYFRHKGTVQAFFPFDKKKPRKVAKVKIIQAIGGFGWISMSFKTVIVTNCCNYTTRAHAIRGARRFCKTIGFECEIVK